MPAIITAPTEDLERVIREKALREHGAADFTFYPNPQVRGMVCKVRPDGTTGAPFYAAAGLKVGAGDWVGHQRVESDTLARMAALGLVVARFVSIEWKRPGETPTPAQLAWAETVRAAGGFAACVHSSDELAAAMVRARRGEDR